MKLNATYTMPYRRRREGKTNYAKRLAMVKSGTPRLCIRKTNTQIIAQLIAFEPAGDKIIAQATSNQLKAFGWKEDKNLPSAYLTGYLIAAKGKKAGVEKAILDIGFSTPVHGSRMFAALKGAVEFGLDVKHDAKALPNKERASGKHIEDYAKTLGDEDYKKKFSKYTEKGINVKELTKLFEQVKEKISKEGEK